MLNSKTFLALFAITICLSLASAAYEYSGNSEFGTSVDVNVDSGNVVTTQTNVQAESSNNGQSTNKSNRSAQERNQEKNMDNIILRINAKAGLNLTSADLDSDAPQGALIRAYLSNGRFAYIRILPETASVTAQQNLNASCADNNCSVKLKEVKSGSEAKLVYQVELQKDAKVLGFIKSKMKIKADVDVETGAVVKVNKPWWATISSESSASAAY